MNYSKIILEEVKRFVREDDEYYDDGNEGGILDKYFQQKNYPTAKYEVPTKQTKEQKNVSGELVASTSFSALRTLPIPINIYKNPTNLRGFEENTRGIITDEGDLYLAQYQNTQHYNIIIALAEKGLLPRGYEKNYYRTLPDDFMCIQRDDDTNTFYSSTAYNNLFPDKYNDLLELASKTQPFDFEMDRYAVPEDGYEDYGYDDEY